MHVHVYMLHKKYMCVHVTRTVHAYVYMLQERYMDMCTCYKNST